MCSRVTLLKFLLRLARQIRGSGGADRLIPLRSFFTIAVCWIAVRPAIGVPLLLISLSAPPPGPHLCRVSGAALPVACPA